MTAVFALRRVLYTASVIVTVVAAPGVASAQQMVGSCPMLPADNIWNTPVDTLPVLSNSASMISTIGANTGLKADFGSGLWDGGPIGIPFITVPSTQTKYPATFYYPDESETGPYAVPLNAPIEGGSNGTGDRHAIAIDTGNCILYELYDARPQASSWSAGSGAIYNLRSNALRPAGWTSADAAGLPIAPGLVTYDEMLTGEIKHAIRITAPRTRREYVWPARHYASSLTGTQYPRMGERFRLKASFDVTPYPPEVQVILRAMKKYGLIMSDNGSAWYMSGKPDSRWNNDNLRALGQVLGSNLEAVDATVLQIDPNSGAARQSGVAVTVSPSSTTARVTRKVTFSATVTGAPSTVTWSVNDIAGGNTLVGTISNTGEYLAPAAAPNPSTVTVRATSTASPSSSGQAAVTVLPMPSISSLSPSPISVGSFTLLVSGLGFAPGSLVKFDGVSLPTTFVSSTQVRGSGTAATAKVGVPVMVSTPDGEVSNTASVSVVAVPVSISISPTSTTVKIRQTRQFAATVQNTANTAVTWKVNGIAGGNSSVGKVSATGLYQAPNAVPTPSIVTVSATSVADPAKTANASVTVSKK